MNSKRSAKSVLLLLVLTSPAATLAQTPSVKDCEPVLTKDYFSYAMKYGLTEDYLKSIDSEAWDEWKRTNDLSTWGVFAAGAFSLTDNYSEFDKKRTKYLETVHYNRTQEQAVNILQLTTGPRAYKAYEACLQSLGSGSGVPLRVWADGEDMAKIDLRVQYINPPGKGGITLTGIVEGGSVSGAPSGHLWAGSKEWKVNQQFPFAVRRTPGASKTEITVIPDDGSAPVRLSLQRADATLTLTYVGSTDLLRAQNRSAAVSTPDNNENRGGCPNEVGHHDGKYCTSRTTVSISVQAPRFLTNARANYAGDRCPWCSASAPALSADGLSAQFYVDNWGSPVQAVLTVDEYEHISAVQCGSDQTLPVVYKQAALLTAVTECLPIATLKWKRFASPGSEGTFRFGDDRSPDGTIVADSKTANPTALLVAYRVDALPKTGGKAGAVSGK